MPWSEVADLRRTINSLCHTFPSIPDVTEVTNPYLTSNVNDLPPTIPFRKYGQPGGLRQVLFAKFLCERGHALEITHHRIKLVSMLMHIQCPRNLLEHWSTWLSRRFPSWLLLGLRFGMVSDQPYINCATYWQVIDALQWDINVRRDPRSHLRRSEVLRKCDIVQPCWSTCCMIPRVMFSLMSILESRWKPELIVEQPFMKPSSGGVLNGHASLSNCSACDRS